MTMMRWALAGGLLAALGACSFNPGMGHPTQAAASQAGTTQAATQPALPPETIRQVQAHLRDDGFYKQGPVDGVWGPETEAAVRSFQNEHRLTSTGQLDVPTLQALNLTNAAAPAQPANTAPTQPMAATPPPPNR